MKWVLTISRSLPKIIVSAVLLTGVAAPAVAQEAIKVGLLLTQVGPTALFARDEARAAQMYIDEVNKAGGINGKKIELINLDTEGKPDRAGSLYRRLAQQDGVVAVIGPDSVFITLGMQSIPSEVKVMSVAAPGLYELVKPEFRDYLVSAWGPYSFAGSLAMAYHADKFKVKRVGMITTADAVGQRIAATARKVGEKIGVQFISEAQPASDRDLLPALRKLASASPAIEALYVFGSGPFANIAMNQAELAGLNVPIFYTGGNVIPSLVADLSPQVAAKVFFTNARGGVVGDTLPDSDPYKKKIQAFSAAYKAKFGDDATLPAAVGYDMAGTIVDAIRAVGTDRTAIAEYIRGKQHFAGVQGVEFARTKKGNGYGVNPDQLIIATIKDGKFAFAGYLKDSLEKVGLTPAVIEQLMKEESILSD
jgi:branched-chain amino acid transport system substrate-binding protein